MADGAGRGTARRAPGARSSRVRGRPKNCEQFRDRAIAEERDMKCPTCRIHDLVEIKIRLCAEQVVLRSCSSCDLRSWEGLDGEMGLRSVLALAASR
jgi:hypothetical protein